MLDAVDQRRRLVAPRFETEASRSLNHEEVEQDLALWRAQARMNRGLGRQQLHVIGDEALQKLLGIVAFDADNAAIRQ